MLMTWLDKDQLTDIFRESVTAAHPDKFFESPNVREVLADAAATNPARVVVLGAGKAAAAMAAALEAAWSSSPLSGMVVTRDGYERPTRIIDVATAGHPAPDARSARVAQNMLKFASGLGQDDLLIGLWSGGGSSLLACPPDGISQKSLGTLTDKLLASGADIHEINGVRKHLSRIAGGRLAKAAAPARLLNLIIPDVVGADSDAVSAIASGPCVPDPTSLAQAREVLKKYQIEPDAGITTHLTNAANETPKSWQEIGVASHNTVLMKADVAVDTAATALEERGFHIAHKDATVTGEARDVAAHHAVLAMSLAKEGKSVAIVTGGELTVTISGNGIGGPNQEYALALAIFLKGAHGICALAADTDGIDGNGAAAGAVVFPGTLERMAATGINPEAALADNDSGSAFAAIDDLLITGPTFTNVNDLRLIVING